MEGKFVKPKVGAAIGTFTMPDGVNITAQIKTLKDEYGINEMVNLTDPPEEMDKEK
jgi:hypothetical protein